MGTNPPGAEINLYDPGVLDMLLARENEINAQIMEELQQTLPNEARLRLLEMQLRIVNDGMLGAQIRAQLRTADVMRKWTIVSAVAMTVAALATVAYVIVAIAK